MTEESFVHESAYIDDDVTLGAGSRVWHFCHLMQGTRIGRNCSFGQNCVVGPDVTIGNGVKVQNNVSIFAGVEIEDDVFLGPSMVFTNVINPRAEVSRKDEFRRTLLKRGSTVGANATILCGTTIGEYGFVGAGAVITRDVPAYALVTGVPGRVTGWMSRAGNRLDFDSSGTAGDPADGSTYRLRDGAVERVDE